MRLFISSPSEFWWKEIIYNHSLWNVKTHSPFEVLYPLQLVVNIRSQVIDQLQFHTNRLLHVEERRIHFTDWNPDQTWSQETPAEAHTCNKPHSRSQHMNPRVLVSSGRVGAPLTLLTSTRSCRIYVRVRSSLLGIPLKPEIRSHPRVFAGDSSSHCLERASSGFHTSSYTSYGKMSGVCLNSLWIIPQDTISHQTWLTFISFCNSATFISFRLILSGFQFWV